MKLVLLMFCVVIAKTQSENGYSRPYGPYMQQGYTRIKRVKYSNPPLRLYSRPPASFPSKGPFSYTPPPSYMMDNDDPPYPGNPYPVNSRPKVSKRPINEGLGEEDLQNFVKYLSKQDLDKILEYTGHNRDSERTRDPYEKQIDHRPTTDEYRNIYNSIQDPESSQKPKEDESKMFSAIVHEIDLDPKFSSYPEKNPSIYRPKNDETDYQAKLNDFEKKKSSNNFINPSNYVTDPTPLSFYTSSPSQYNNALLDTQESMQSQITYSGAPSNGVSKDLPEELLPRPVNLRDEADIYDVSHSNNVHTVVKADSYKLENFGSLPLMNYNSKLDTLSSYHVPHYTVSTSV